MAAYRELKPGIKRVRNRMSRRFNCLRDQTATANELRHYTSLQDVVCAPKTRRLDLSDRHLFPASERRTKALAAMDWTKRLAVWSVVVGTIVLGLKYVAYHLTGSIALYSDALESIVNVATAIATLFAVHVSAMPADAKHPFGHSKVEYFSAVLEGVLIVAAALSIFRQAYFGFLNPAQLDAPLLGLAINGAAGVLNALWGWLLITQGRKHRSLALVADGRHLLTDVFTSVGVLIGVGAAYGTGIAILDPAIAVLVAINILWSGWRLLKESVGGLMDEAVPPATLDRIKNIIRLQADGALEVHDLRTRRAGKVTFVEFHLVVPGAMSVAHAHDICDRLENALHNELEDARVTIHVEPEKMVKHSGVLVLSS